MIPFPFQDGQVGRGFGQTPPDAPTSAPQWDPATVSSPLSLSMSNARVTLPTGNSSIAKTVRGTKPLTSGKWYWEVQIVDAINGAGATTGCGIADAVFAFASQNLGNNSTANAGGLWLNGGLYFSGSPTSQGITFADGDTMMFALDIDNGRFWVGKNNTFVGNPAAGTGASKTGLAKTLYYPAATPWSSDGSSQVILDIKGVTNATYSPPSGFTPYGL